MSSSSESKSSKSAKSSRSVSPVVSEPESFSGKPMNDPDHNVPNRDAGIPPDSSLPTPNETPNQPSAKELLIADSEAEHVDMGVRHSPGPVKHNPGAGTVEEGIGTYDTEPDCPDAAYLAGDCDRSEKYYETRAMRSPDEVRAARKGESK